MAQATSRFDQGESTPPRRPSPPGTGPDIAYHAPAPCAMVDLVEKKRRQNQNKKKKKGKGKNFQVIYSFLCNTGAWQWRILQDRTHTFGGRAQVVRAAEDGEATGGGKKRAARSRDDDEDDAEAIRRANTSAQNKKRKETNRQDLKAQRKADAEAAKEGSSKEQPPKEGSSKEKPSIKSKSQAPATSKEPEAPAAKAKSKKQAPPVAAVEDEDGEEVESEDDDDDDESSDEEGAGMSYQAGAHRTQDDFSDDDEDGEDYAEVQVGVLPHTHSSPGILTRSGFGVRVPKTLSIPQLCSFRIVQMHITILKPSLVIDKHRSEAPYPKLLVMCTWRRD